MLQIGDTIKCHDTLDALKYASALMNDGYILKYDKKNKVFEIVDIIEKESELE